MRRDELGAVGPAPAVASPGGNDQPVYTIAGLILDAAELEAISNDCTSSLPCAPQSRTEVWQLGIVSAQLRACR
jgi:hypothetical protein